MKINKSKSPFVSGADAPDEKDIAKAIKGGKFSEALSALESTATDGAAPSQASTILTEIAAQYDLSDEENRQAAVQQSAEFLVKSRLGEKYRDSEKIIKDLGKYVADDPFLKSKLLSILQKLSDAKM
jgi:hypothetical protein